jgi:hypothetical protein
MSRCARGRLDDRDLSWVWILQQTISTLGLGVNHTAPDKHHLAAEIALSNDGKFAYVSNRDTTTDAPDTLATFLVNYLQLWSTRCWSVIDQI